MFVNFNILNQLGSPAINSNTFANRPAAGQTGRLFVSTDTFEIYRDNGTTWDLIGGPGSSTITGTGTATQVAYFTSSQAIGSSSNLYWDNTNKRLGIGTATPTVALDVVGSENLTGSITANSIIKLGGLSTQYLMADGSVTTLTNPITGTGTATQVAYFTGTSSVGSSSNLYWDNTNIRLGIGTATPGVRLDIHGTGTIQHINSTGTTNNGYLAFQRAGSTTFSIGDNYNGGSNYFRIFSNSLSADVAQIFAASGKANWQATETYSTGLARANFFDYNLTVAAGPITFTSPNSITALGASLDLTLNGSATIPSGARTGLDAYNSVSFTSIGTLTMSQGTQIRPYSNLTTGWAFAGSTTGTITHLAGLRVLFPDNSGSAVSVTNNYGLLINDQTANTGTVTYTNRWGIYQEGSSDLNYLAANLLIGSTTNSGEALQVTGTAKVTSTLTANSLVKSGGTSAQILAADGSVITAGTNITISAGTISASGGLTGSGTTNYLPKFTASTTVGDSRFLDDGTQTFLGNGSTNASPSTAIFSATGGSGTNIAGAELRLRGGASTGTGAGGPITFYTSAAGTSGSSANAGTERMRLDASGNLGIGTTSPISSSGYKILTINGSTGTFTEYQENGTNTFRIGTDNGLGGFLFTQSALGIRFGTNDNEKMRLTAAGNLGIGTTTTGSKLQVNGNAAIGYSASTAAPTNGLAVAGNIQAGSTTAGAQINVFSSSYGTNGLFNAYGTDGVIKLQMGGLASTQAYIYTPASVDLLLFTGAAEKARLTSAGEFQLKPSANTAALSTSGSYSLTGANAQSLLDLAGTWNTTGNPTAIKLNITNTASGASSYLMDLQVGSATQFRVTKAGAIRTTAPTTGTANDWKLGTRVATSVVLDTSQYIEIEVGGTFYRLAVVNPA